MKTSIINKIAKAELRMMFCTPVAWLMLIVFAVLCGLFFTEIFSLLVESQSGGRPLPFLTNSLFSSPYYGLLPQVQSYLYLFIPLVSMGMLSRDLSSGSIKLLYSSPITDTQIVLGKFVAMMAYGLSMMAVVACYAVFGIAVIEHADWPSILTGMLGLYLLICTYSAIGIFMSSLTSYQVVAALATFGVLAVFNYVGSVGQSILWVQDITYWLSMSGRCETFLSGMICSEDVIYFLAVPAFFLVLTVLRMSNRRIRRSATKRWAGYLGAALVLVVVGYVSSRPRFMSFYDSTETKMLTLTPPSQEVMKKVEGPVEITSYANVLEENFFFGIPSRYNSDMSYFQQYFRFKPDMRVRHVLYWADSGDESLDERFPDKTDAERAEHLAETYDIDFDKFLSPEEVGREMDLSDEGYRFVRHIRLADGRTTFLRVYDDSSRQPDEKEITAAFKRLVEGPVQVGFLVGREERDINREADKDYYVFAQAKTFRHSLLNNGFDSRNVSLAGGARIPDDIDLLVIADPRAAFGPEEQAEIARYIASGRNLIIATEPGRQAYAGALVEPLGLKFMEGRLVAPAGEQQQNLVLADFTSAAGEQSRALKAMRRRNYKVTMPNAVGIVCTEDAGFKAEPYLMSDTLGWNEYQTIDFVNETATADPARGEVVGPVPVAMLLTRPFEGGRDQKIFVLGDADCFSNGELLRNRYAVYSGNFTLLYELFRNLSDGKYPINTSRPQGSDDRLRMQVEQLALVKWAFVGIIPFLLLVATILIFMRRKSK